ncbi:hypothetical protein BOW53_09360 [Solemya pervernicosa gill symbiont]|uniref:N-acetyltransferase domain-containing protein n=2 Tax=Gammaproteobacteria incertae sedis TaxID=118884 RepID=A0A1T2L4H7_9GAMM|nr:GNAT family N-acetyltransferase [Candidatus Reidiella endopervernicosa]OOZ39974.1 hypothetical protein BOW53_09360 [Solemya pervernicosa gill symbiont]QKQ27774.1 GNAT family N-acetyltransferase [Candidatus Reidiella endopervernicosa]
MHPPIQPSFRPVTPDDFAAVCELVGSPDELYMVQPGAKFPWTVRQVARLVDQRRTLTVMEHNDRVIGFADLYGIEPGSHAFIGNLVVAALYRNKGLGRLLIAEMLKAIYGELALPEARIAVFESNRAAHRLYQKLGFKQYGTELRNREGQQLTLINLRRVAD